MHFCSEKPIKNPSKTTSEPLENRCQKRVVFQHRFFQVSASNLKPLGPPTWSQVRRAACSARRVKPYCILAFGNTAFSDLLGEAKSFQILGQTWPKLALCWIIFRPRTSFFHFFVKIALTRGFHRKNCGFVAVRAIKKSSKIGSWGLSWPVLGLSWAVLACLGPVLGCLGLSWVCLGPVLACLGPVLTCLGPIVSLSWGSLGLSWLVSALSWSVLGLSWACPGLSWACLGTFLDIVL